MTTATMTTWGPLERGTPLLRGRQFSLESQMVTRLRRSLGGMFEREAPLFCRGELPVGPRIADIAVCALPGAPQWERLSALERVSHLELRLLTLLVLRPLRSSTLAAHVSIPGLDRVVARLTRLGLVTRHRGDVLRATEWQTYVPRAICLIEAKLVDWEQALLQARYYRGFADQAFVALPSSHPDARRAAIGCHVAGVGLMLVEPSGKVQTLVPARMPRVDRFRRHMLAVEVLAQLARDHAYAAIHPASHRKRS